jgi:hypothetical protein
MLDVLFITGGIACFWLAITYTHGCETLRSRRHD